MILVSPAYLSVDHEGSRIEEGSHWQETQSVTYKPWSLTHQYVTSSLWSWYLQLICAWIMKAAELKRAVTGRRHNSCPNVLGDQSFGSLWRYVDSLWWSECNFFTQCHDSRVSCHDVQNSGAIIYWKLDENKLNIPSNLNYGGETFLNFLSFVWSTYICYTVLPMSVYWLTAPQCVSPELQCVSPSPLELTNWWMWHLACDSGILISLALSGSWWQWNWRGHSMAWYSVSLSPSVFGML